MSRASDRLREFHEAFDVPAPSENDGERPGVAEMALRRGILHMEEHAEVIDALSKLRSSPLTGDDERPLRESLARELADTLVIAYGTADLFGIDLDAAFDAVMDANMAKLPDCEKCGGRGWRGVWEEHPPKFGGGHEREPTDRCEACDGTGKGKPIKRHDGKVLKPEGLEEPDMSGAIYLPTELDRRDLRLGRFAAVVIGHEGAKIHVTLKPDPRLRSAPTLAVDPPPEGMVTPPIGENCMVEVGPGFEWARMVRGSP